MSKRLEWTIWLTVPLSIGMPVSSMAQSALEEVVVTARRVEERLQDVPISMTVFNQQQLSNRNIVMASDLATYTPSLSADTRNGTENSSFAIRGFTQEIRTTPSVAVYFADVVAPRGGAVVTGGGDGGGPGAFFDLQNVQVLKGPQGTLFGRNTTGGAVLLVPTKPTSEFGGYGEVSFGNYDMKRYQGVFNAPLGDAVRLRLGVDRQTRDGYETNISAIGPARFADIDYISTRASLVVDVTPNIENYTIGTYSRSDTNGSLSQVFICNPAGSLALFTCPQAALQQSHDFYTVQNSRPDAESWSKQWQAINTTTWHTSDVLTVKNIASYGQFKSILRQDVFGTNFFVPSLIPGLGGLSILGVASNPPAGLSNNDQRTFSEELQFQGRSESGRLVWQAGGYLEHSDPEHLTGSLSGTFIHCQDLGNLQCTDVIGLLSGAPGRVGAVGSSVGTNTYRNYGAYGQGTYSITDEVKLTTGLRYTEDRTTGMGEQSIFRFPNPLNPGFTTHSCSDPTASLANDCRVDFTQNSHAPTWLIDLDYKPTDDLLLYGKYARGYRQGSVNPFAPPGFNTFEPEHVNTYEVGAKSSFHSVISGTFNLATFYNDFTDQQLQAGFQSSTNAASPTVAILNAGKSRIWGAEIESSLLLPQGFELDIGAAYLNTRLLSEEAIAPAPGSLYDTVTFTSHVGGPLPFTPKFKGTATAAYRLPIPEGAGRVAIALTYVYTGSQVTAADSPFGTLASRNLVNVNLNWISIAGGRADVSLFATNLFNEKYATFVPGVYNTGFGIEARSIGEPRMFGARLRVRFGE